MDMTVWDIRMKRKYKKIQTEKFILLTAQKFGPKKQIKKRNRFSNIFLVVLVYAYQIPFEISSDKKINYVKLYKKK